MLGGSAIFEVKLKYQSVREAAAASDFRAALPHIELDGLARLEARLRGADFAGPGRPPCLPPPIGARHVGMATARSAL